MPHRSLKPYVVPVFIPHSGCPHRCTYCNQHAVSGAKDPFPRPGDIDANVHHYLQYRRQERSFTEISFYGGNFLGLDSVRIRELLEAAAAWIDSGKVGGIRFSTRPDTVDEQKLELLTPYPVTTVEIGVQSMDDTVLTRIKRGHTAADSARAVGLLKKRGYRTGCQIMTGLPGEDEALAVEGARAVSELEPDFVRIYPLIVLAGSALASEYRTGTFVPLTLEACIRQTAKLYRVFSDRKIPVVRMGLQASADLAAPGAVLAGPYHPAFGHMVLSRLMFERACQRLDAVSDLPAKVTLHVNPSSISRMRGLKNANMNALKDLYPAVGRFDVRPDPGLPADEVILAPA